MATMRIGLLCLLCIITNIGRSAASMKITVLEELNEKISNKAILCLHQDPHGLMWFGTYDGLNLYDGKSLKTFRHAANKANTLSGNTIHRIGDADKGFLWISTQRGLDKFSLQEQEVTESFPQYRRVNLITVDKAGNSWMINKSGIILFYEAAERRMWEIPEPNMNANDIRGLFTDESGRVCLVKKNASLQYLALEPTNEAGDCPYKLTVKKETFHDRGINQVFYENNWIVFIDEDCNMYMYNSLKQCKVLLRNMAGIISKYGLIASICFYKDEVYMAFMHSGIVRFGISPHQADIEPVKMSIGIFCLAKDRYREAIWTGTDGAGVQLLSDSKEHYGNILLKEFPFPMQRPVRALYTDEENTLWIGTKGDGIVRISHYETGSLATPGQIRHFKELRENPVYVFARGKFNDRDELWIGTDQNLSYYSYKHDRIFQVKDATNDGHSITYVCSFCEENDSTLWVSAKGLYKIIIDKKQTPYTIVRKTAYPAPQYNSEEGNDYYSMIYDGQSTIFLGSKGGDGTNRFDVHTSTWFSMPYGNTMGDVISLCMGTDPALYIGTSSGFVHIKDRMNPTKGSTCLTCEDGLQNDMVHGIMEDNERFVWFSTNKGLVKYNPRNGLFANVKSVSIKVTEFSDGSYWKAPDGRLFFGGVNGVMWIDPDKEAQTDVNIPPFLFTDLKLPQDRKRTLYDYTARDKAIELKHGQNTFHISFSVLDYVDGDSYDYFYKLEGYDPQWVSLGKENTIRFTNIPPGKYTLKVTYRNNTLSDSRPSEHSLCLIVLPPWYLSTGAYAVYALLFLLASLSVALYIRKRIKRNQLRLQERLKEEQKEKIYASKMKFFTNITHELYTPLTLINGAMEQIGKGDLSPQQRKYIQIMNSNVLSLNELVQEILDVRKVEEEDAFQLRAEQTDLALLCKELELSFSLLAQQNCITMHTSIPPALPWSTDVNGFRKIVSNLLSNALKYTPVGGTVTLTATVEGEYLSLKVRNTGKGIEPEQMKTLFSRNSILETSTVNANNQMTARNGLGLYICHSLVHRMGGNISVASQVNEYTEFTVLLPSLPGTPGEESNEKRTATCAPEENRPDAETAFPGQTDACADGKAQKSINVADLETAAEVSVLVVDDNREIVELVSDLLAPHYTVWKAASAKEALQMLEKQSPSMVITDIMMPEIDGFAFIRMLRENKYCKHVPVIALSAKTGSQDQKQGYETGADAYITKPFSSEVLLSVVHRLLHTQADMKAYYNSADSTFENLNGKPMLQKERKFLEEVLAIVKDNLESPDLGADFIADKMKLTPRSLYRQVKKIAGMPPTELIKDYKLTYAAKLLLTTNLSHKEVLARIGIRNKTYFYKEFSKKFSMSPKEYKDINQKQKDE